MHITEKYTKLLLPYFDGVVKFKKFGKDAYSFACPICAERNHSEPNWSEAKKARKRRARTAGFLPHHKCNSIYYYTCRRSRCTGSVSIKRFLQTYNKPLYKKFILESEPENALRLQDEVGVGGTVIQKSIDFVPDWNERWEKTRKEELNGT